MFVGVDTLDLLHPIIRSPSRASTFGGDSDIIFGVWKKGRFMIVIEVEPISIATYFFNATNYIEITAMYIISPSATCCTNAYIISIVFHHSVRAYVNINMVHTGMYLARHVSKGYNWEELIHIKKIR